ncbi:hypothetical protein [Streptomyces wuyuanensis]|uniref:hypothetical protein n=1 Tax=Streptomyces wuyuanensis TaxID=1196353 RepID=UPI00343AB8E5
MAELLGVERQVALQGMQDAARSGRITVRSAGSRTTVSRRSPAGPAARGPSSGQCRIRQGLPVKERRPVRYIARRRIDLVVGLLG